MPLQPSVQTSVRVQTLFFDMNSFFASVAQQEEPQLQGRPLGVLTTDAPGAACIAISVEAKARGMKMGVRRNEASRLCPDMVFRPAKHDVYVEYHHAIRAAVDRVLPIEAAHSVDEFSCRLVGQQQELGAALDIAVTHSPRSRREAISAMLIPAAAAT